MKNSFWFVLFTVISAQANAQFLLRYDKPASKFTSEQRNNPNKLGFMQEALPLGNGRLGAMFSDCAVADEDFGTYDVLVVLPISRLNARYVAYYGENAEPHA